MKHKYKNINLRSEACQLVEICNKIIEDYQSQGLRLTLRQLYYCLVVKNIIQNKEKSYKKLSSVVSDARLGGLMDWNAIEDRIRRPQIPTDFKDLAELVEAAVASYRLDRWAGQENYVECWVEKDAISGVLAPLARKYHITLVVNRGYSSQSAMYESAQRFIHNGEEEMRDATLLYLGDHDSSGEDMVRDIRDRLAMFNVQDLKVEKIALTMDQIDQYDPPPNPVKVSDPRAAQYMAAHGDTSWEVDALPPTVLQQIVEDSIVNLLDVEMMDKIIRQEERDKLYLQQVVAEKGKKKKKGR